MALARGLAALSVPPCLSAGSTPASRRTIRVAASPSGRGCRRRSMVVRAGGPPSTNVLILAFAMPFSLFVGTLITAARVADDLDERFEREMEISRAIMEENDASEEDDGGDHGEEEVVQPVEREEEEALVTAAAAAPRTRNRPIRQVY